MAGIILSQKSGGICGDGSGIVFEASFQPESEHSKPSFLLVSPNKIAIPISGEEVKEGGLGETIRRGGANCARVRGTRPAKRIMDVSLCGDFCGRITAVIIKD